MARTDSFTRATGRRRRSGALRTGGPYTQTLANGINDSSWIVGTSGNGPEGFVWTPQNGMQGIGFLPGGNYSELEAINGNGTAFGDATPAGATLAHAAIWDSVNGLRDLDSLIVNPPAAWTPRVAVAISNNGLITGVGDSSSGSNDTTFPTPGQHAFVLDAGTLTAIPAPAGRAAWAASAFSRRPLIRAGKLPANTMTRITVCMPSCIQRVGTVDIGNLGLSATGASTPYTQAFAINDLGTVVGSDGLADGSKRGFLWTEAGGIVEVQPPAGVLIDGIMGINDRGQLIGGGHYANDTALGYRGFVLTPVAEPSTLALAVPFALLALRSPRAAPRATWRPHWEGLLRASFRFSRSIVR